MVVIISKVLVIFVYVAIGFAANRLKVLPGESVKYFTSLIMDITVPCLMISSLTGQELNDSLYRNTIIALILTSLVYVIVGVATTIFSDHVFTHKEQQDRNVLATAMTGCNSGFMGFPITKAVYGSQVFYYVVIQNISSNLYLFLMSLVQLHHKEEKQAARKGWKESLRPLVNISTIVTLISVVMLFSGIRLPEYAMDIITEVGDITIPLSMMLVGVQLGGADFAAVLRDPDLLITAFIKLIAAPALILLLVMPLPIDPIVKLTAVICTCFPSAAMGVAISAKENKNSTLMSECVAVTVILSMITVPVWIIICNHIFL